MCMGFGCNACGVVGCRIIDSPRERLIAMLTNSFAPCNGRFPLLIFLCSVFFAGSAAGGSLLLVPLACSLFGISNDIAMQVVGVGFIVGVIQDSCETAINSSTDVLYTAVAELSQRPRAQRKV